MGIDSKGPEFKQENKEVALFEYVINFLLDEDDKCIMLNEFLLDKKGTWYINEGLTTSTYYRHRRKAYNNFLTCLDK